MTKTTTISARCTIASVAWFASAAAALAQSGSRPFSIAGGEGGGGAEGGITGWLIAEQSRLTHLMAAKVHALHGDPSAVWGLIAFGLAYGVFHAAGPGHGKAVIASYMLANERSLKRGALLSLLAALLQASVAIALVGTAGFAFNATALEMNRAASGIQLASYAGVAAIGIWLVWRKGGELVATLRRHFERGQALAAAPAYAGVAWNAPALTLPMVQFQAAAPGGAAFAPDQCLHAHAPDPALLDGAFSWRAAAGTVIAAGVRPCSGAILVLVFALAQGLFAAGVEATFAMALGTAVTTGALASIAVFAKSTAVRLAAGDSSRAALVARSFEFAAALGVLAFGVALMLGARGGA
jgi:nickel/cobalt exporter